MQNPPSELEPQVTERLGALLEARMVVRSEMVRLARVQPLDRAALERLRAAVRGFANEADALILTVVQQKAPEPLVTAVEEVFDALREAEEQIEAVLRRGRR